MNTILAKSIDDDGEVVIWKTPYNHNTEHEANRTAQYNDEPSKTQQSQRDETDINFIVDKFLKTGQINEVQQPPQYGDFTTTEDFHTMQNRIAETNALFYKLPAGIRSSFGNDPGAWLGEVNAAIAADDRQALRTMGIATPDRPPELPEATGTPPVIPAPETLKEPPGGSKT